MYAVRRWDEERIIQGLAIAMCLGLLAMAVMPAISSGNLAIYLKNHADNPYYRDFAEMALYISSLEAGAYMSLILAGAAMTPAAWAAFGAVIAAGL